MQDRYYDVVVVGGGTAGVIAAWQSALAGVKTLLVEKTETLGGSITNARVFSPGLFHAWGKQIIGGLGYALVKKCVEENGDTLPDFSVWDIQKHWTAQIPLNTFLYPILCDEVLRNAGVEVLFHTLLAGITEEPNGLKKLTLCGKTGLFTVNTRVIIDCTGDANAVQIAGYAVEKSDSPQPSTYICRLDGYDLASIDMQALKKAYETEVEKGNLRYTDMSWQTDSFDPVLLKKHGDNANHVYYTANLAETSEGRSELAIEGRLALLRVYRFLKKQKGFEKLQITYLAPECGVRESVRIVGETRMEIQDFLDGKVYDDAVCYTFYPVDLHKLDGTGLKNAYMRDGVVPTIPRSAMLPKGAKNFLVAGRCVASEQLVNSAVRVEASCMAMGQAAGALAALSVLEKTDVDSVAMESLYRLLEKYGAITPKKK